VVVILGGIALLELVTNRIVARLLRTEFLQPRSSLTRALDDIGLFAFQFLSVLGLMVLIAGIGRVMVAGQEFRPGARMSLPIVGGVFVALSSLAMLVKLPGNLLFHLHLSFLFVTLLLALAVLASHASVAVKLGVVSLVAATGVKLVPAMMARLSAEPRFSALANDVFSYTALALIVTGSILFVPRRGRLRAAPVITFLVVCGAAVLVRADWETAYRVAMYGFGVELPIHPWGQLAVLAALAATLYSTLSLLSVPGVHRLRGYGLMLLTLGGLSLELPAQLTLVALGFLCVAESAVRSDGKPIAREAFEQVVRRAAALIGAQQATITGTPGFEMARLHAPGDGRLTVQIARRAGVISEVEIALGEVPPRDPPFCVELRSNAGLGPHEPGARVETGDAAFDRAFLVHDRRGAGAALLDDDMRKRMSELVTGWLAVYPQRGVIYRATSLPSGDDSLATLVTFVKEIAQRTA
jgi:hypothetical protein